MSKSHLNVLIVEDDVTQGKALSEAFGRAGYKVTLCETSVQALTQSQRIEFHILVVDCMLPKMNGVDLVEEILNLIPNKPKVFMISGIYKDKKFIQEATTRTKAEAFFVKPLNLEELLAHADRLLADKVVAEKPPILSLYSASPLEPAEVLKLIEDESTLHAFHLPKLFQRIQQAQLNGELHLVYAVGEVCSVSFSKGRVFDVRTPDKESFFGSIAISKGYVTPEDVLEALRDPQQKMLGQKLIESMSVSPHAIEIILEEQLALRLSQTVQDDVVSLQWLPKKASEPNHVLATERFNALQDDWLNSKITPDWIHSTLMVWGGFEIAGNFHPKLRGSQSIGGLLKDKNFNAQQDLMPLFRALLHGQAHLEMRLSGGNDFSFLDSRLDKMSTDLKHMNYFQFLGVGEKAHQREISKSYESLKEAFDPANQPASCPPEILQKCSDVLQRIEKIYQTLSNDIPRANYIASLQSRRQQEALEAEPIYRGAIIELQTGHAKPAAEKFQSLLDRKLEFRDLRAYRIWAGLKVDRGYSDMRLDQIPPEERHSAPYNMARGVHFQRMGQFKRALESFRTAHILDPRLTIAKNELQRLVRELESSGSQNRDLLKEVSSVVESLFGRSRKGA